MRARPEYLPSPQQIARQCRQIRDRWSAAERQRRLVGYGKEIIESVWTPPQIDTAGCTARVRRVAVEQSP